MKNKYCVVVVRTGVIFVEAETEADAMRIANEQPTDAISWSDDWEATDAEEYDGSYSGDYVSEETPASVKYNVFKEPSIVPGSFRTRLLRRRTGSIFQEPLRHLWRAYRAI